MAKKKSTSKKSTTKTRRSPAAKVKDMAPGLALGAAAAVASESFPTVAKYGDSVPGGTSTVTALSLFALSRFSKGKRRKMFESAALGAAIVAGVDIYRGQPVTAQGLGNRLGIGGGSAAEQLRSLPQPKRTPADFLKASAAHRAHDPYGIN